MEITIVRSEILRRILNRNLKLQLDQINFEEMRMYKDIRKLSYKLLRSPNFSLQNPSHFVVHPKMIYPYSMILDEYLLFFSFNRNFNDFLNTSFHGIKNEVFEAPENMVSKNEEIFPIKEQVLLDFNSSIIEMMSQRRIKQFHRLWDVLHMRMNGKGKIMPQAIKNEILQALISNETELGRKYTRQEVMKVTARVLTK